MSHVALDLNRTQESALTTRIRPLITITLGTLAAALTLGVAHAEEYQGVHTFESQRSAESVRAEAVAAAHAPNQNVVSGSRGPLPFQALASRDSVHQEARAV